MARREARGSLTRRLVLGAVVFIAAALLAAGLVVDSVLHRFVTSQIDQRLDAQLLTLTAALDVDEDGTPRLARVVDGPPFDRALSGWYWQVLGTEEPLRSSSLAGADLTAPRPPGGSRPVPAEGRGPRGEALHMRLRTVTLPGGSTPLTIVAGAPPAEIQAPLGTVMGTLALALGALGAALVGAVVLQVRLGLRPLTRLRASLTEVGAGRLDRVPDDQPAEVRPLVRELNGLLDRNAESLARARSHAANLAHGLKTPLATLAAIAADPGRDPDGELGRLVMLMDRRITHHLRRARAAALGGAAWAGTPLAPRVRDLLLVMAKVHPDRGLASAVDIGPDVVVACDPQDVDEMLGNLLDNAFKWARTRVRVGAVDAQGRFLAVLIEDDGRGLSDAEAAIVLRPGERLDEAVPGDGFGLSITRELAMLYGGGLTLGRSPLGGLTTVLTIPAARRG